MTQKIENNSDILWNNIDWKLNELTDFIEYNFRLWEMIANYWKEKYKKEEKELISWIEKELNIESNIS